MTLHHVILVPGFFGFGKFGEISYFHGVREALGDAFARLGVTARITEVSTLPTASIRHRAARVLETLAEVVEREPGPVHLVGHSTGGLDARLAIAPTASLPTPVKFTAYDRVRSIVTVCCPHFGTPIATYFTGAFGRWLLRTGASYLAFMLDRGRIPLKLLLRLGYWIVRLRDPRAETARHVRPALREAARRSLRRSAQRAHRVPARDLGRPALALPTHAGCMRSLERRHGRAPAPLRLRDRMRTAAHL